MNVRTSLNVVMLGLLSLALFGCATYTTKYDAAEKLMAQGKYNEAIKTFDEFVKEPKSDTLKALDPHAMVNMGLCYKQQENTKEAEAAFKNVVEKYSKTLAAKHAQAELDALK